MRIKDVKLGEFYRVKGNENYCWAQAIEILPPKTGINDTNATVVKCKWVIRKEDVNTSSFIPIKYFKVSNLFAEKE